MTSIGEGPSRQLWSGSRNGCQIYRATELKMGESRQRQQAPMTFSTTLKLLCAVVGSPVENDVDLYLLVDTHTVCVFIRRTRAGQRVNRIWTSLFTLHHRGSIPIH